MDALDRTLQPTRRTLGDVDPAQPLDTTHPLLDGLQGFWLPLPRLTGGSRLYDLSANSRHGDLTNMDPTTDWVSGAYTTPSLKFSAGTGKGVLYNPAADLAVTEDDSFTVFVYFIARSGSGVVFTQQPDSDGELAWLMRFGGPNGSTDMTVRLSKQNESWNGIADILSYPIGSLNLLALNWDGSTVTSYLNGEQKNSDTPSSFTAGFSGGGEIALGFKGLNASTTQSSNTNVFLAGIYQRSLSGREHTILYEQTRRGFPDLLRRRSDVGLLGGGSGGTADTVSPSTATALAEGFDPALTATPNTISAGTAQAAAQGLPATVTATQNTVAAGTAQAAAQGFEPTITADPNTIAATTGQATAQGFDPTISEGAAGDTLVADLGTAQAQGFDPTITTNPATVTPGLGQATANGFDPDVVADPSEINTGQAQAAATGFDPTVTTNARTVVPQLGEAQAQGFEPAVVDGTVGVATTMEIEARPLYEIDVEAKPLYRIRLFVKEQLP